MIEIIASGSVIVAAITGVIRFYALKKTHDIALARIMYLEAQIKKASTDEDHAMNRIREYYDSKADGKQDEIKSITERHDMWKTAANMLTKELEKHDPKWFENSIKRLGR